MKAHEAPAAGKDLDPRTPSFIAELSRLLIDRGLLDELALRRAVRAQNQSGERFDMVLTRLGLLTETQLTEVLSGHLGIALLRPSELPAAALYRDELSATFLKASRLLPVMDSENEIVVATADPFNREAADALAFLLNRQVSLRLAAASDIERTIDQLYSGASSGPRAEIPVGTAGEDDAAGDLRRLEDMASEAPVIRLVNELVTRAVEAQASDIHIEPREDCVRVRFRVDGLLHTVETLPVTVRLALSSRIKVMAHLNIAERRLPQDGRIKVTVRGREIDLRVSTMPTMCGESVVLRILDRSSVALDYQALGFSGETLSNFQRLLAEPNGIILVTGPTGSGKTTTLYTALSSLNRSEHKLFTVEDPIEYQLAGVNQIHVNPRIGLTFASALRSMLRQDPDIIMIGEIRDLETAEIAIRASLTGHLVLSTVHTNSAAATLTRLLDMGVEDYLLASSLTGVLAQRLVRRLCPRCAVSADLPEALETRLAGLLPGGALRGTIKKACGCQACRNTGFQGRTAVYELIVVSDGVRSALLSGSSERDIASAAQKEGFVPMLNNGIGKVFAGETTLEEVFRVTRIGDAAL